MRLSSARWVGLRPPARSPAGARSRRRGPCSASPRLGALRRAGARLACRLRLSLVCARAPSRLLWALPGPRWALVPAPAGPPCLAASACPWVAGRSSAARGLSARWRGPRGVAFRAPARWGLSGAGWCRRSAPVRSRPRQAGAVRPALTAGAVVGYVWARAKGPNLQAEGLTPCKIRGKMMLRMVQAPSQDHMRPLTAYGPWSGRLLECLHHSCGRLFCYPKYISFGPWLPWPTRRECLRLGCKTCRRAPTVRFSVAHAESALGGYVTACRQPVEPDRCTNGPEEHGPRKGRARSA